MENAEFEEKDFESALYHQLTESSPNLWTPGQVFENHFGIDAALKTQHAFFLASVHRHIFHRKLILKDLNWGYVWRSYKKKHGLPSFETNALLQAKRPQHLKGTYPKLRGYGIAGQYWRFEIVAHQQRLLERLQRKVNKRAVVSYVCPAFHLWDELDSHIAARRLPEHCSYVSADAMSGHRHWCFTQPGGSGVASSETEKVDAPPLQERLGMLEVTNQRGATSRDRASQSLEQFRNAIVETVEIESGEKKII